MTNSFQCAQIYQILALNDEMLKSGCITRDEHDFVRHVQTDKLSKLHGRGGRQHPGRPACSKEAPRWTSAD